MRSRGSGPVELKFERAAKLPGIRGAVTLTGTAATLAALKAKGIEAAWGPMKRPDYARAEIRDPDGNPIELRQWYRR